MYNLPNLNDLKSQPAKDQSARLAEAINAWKNYFEKQAVIKVTPGSKSGYVAFRVSTPLTFLHLNDFKSGLEIATTVFSFMENGTVETEERIGLGAISFVVAWGEIASRTVGGFLPTDIVPEMPTDILTEQEEQELINKVSMFEERLDLWMEKFRKLPVVLKVVRCEDKNPDRLIEIEIKTAFPSMKDYDAFTLNLGNVVDRPDWDIIGETSTTYDQWEPKVETLTWEEFYQELIKLSNLYVSVPQP